MAYIFQKTLLSFVRRKPCSNLVNNYLKLPYVLRTFITGRILADNYEGDGKTTVTFLNKEHKHLIMINAFNNFGFRLNNGIFAMGPLVAFPRTVLQWNISDITDVTPESLALFHLLEPKLDILVIGTGNKNILPSKNVLAFLKSCKISTEILNTQQACATFNFLNAERRYVAGAFIPPTSVDIFEDEMKILHDIKAMDYYGPQPFSKIET